MLRERLIFFVVVGVGACIGASCDPKVMPSSEASRAPATGPLSVEGESCAAAADCAAGLRCVALACRPASSSRVGDFHWTAGRLALDKGEAGKAADALQLAVAKYETDKLPAPAALLCDYGAALRRKTGDAKAAEQAARFLHRCLLGTPPGSSEYRVALVELTALEEQGLDSSLLARDQPADAYLTRALSRPPGFKFDIEPSTPSRDKGYTAFIGAVRAGGEAGLSRCFEAYVQAAAKDRVSVLLTLKYRQTLGDDDIVVGTRLDVDVGPGSTGATPEAAADRCVRDVVLPIAAEFAKDKGASSSNWQGGIEITLAAGS